LPGVTRALFENETSPIRFEKFCIDVLTEAEGIQMLPTSRSWDRARDAKALQNIANQTPVLCASLATDIDTKVRNDLQRLGKTTEVQALFYCSAVQLSEHAVDKLEAAIRNLLPTLGSVQVLGAIQLLELAERNETITRKHYEAEIRSVEQALTSEPALDDETQSIGLRLALTTQTGEDAHQLRSDLAKRLVAEALATSNHQTAEDIAASVSKRLHLPRPMSASFVSDILTQMEAAGLLTVKKREATLTTKGKSFAKEIPEEASEKLLEGRAAVYDAILRLSGHRLSDDIYNQVWDCLQDGLADLFCSHGSSVVAMVHGILAGDGDGPRGEERALLEGVGDKVAALFVDSTRGSEVRQAVIDMFSERDTEAFRWLTRTCLVYVMVCSLGLEALSATQVKKALNGVKLVADSDVVISLLCEGERNHHEMVRLVQGWRSLGGQLLAAPAVLEEVSLHAAISEYDYRAMEDRLDQMSDDDADHLIGNAFVRTFRSFGGGHRGRNKWQQYVRQFRGEEELDYANILEIIRDEYGFELLSDASETEAGFERQVVDFAAKRAAADSDCEPQELDPKTRGKCERDGKLIGAVHSARQAARRGGIGGTTLILSSAGTLRAAGHEFREKLGRPDLVVTGAALGFLLALAPGVHLGLGSLRALLFDHSLAAKLTPLQRFAYRVIEASDEYNVPWARRATLQRELRERILSDAKARGEGAQQLQDKVLNYDDVEYSAAVVGSVLDGMAVTADTVAELQTEKRQRRQLEKQLLEAKTRERFDRQRQAKQRKR